jgi:hypothetical protein
MEECTATVTGEPRVRGSATPVGDALVKGWEERLEAGDDIEVTVFLKAKVGSAKGAASEIFSSLGVAKATLESLRGVGSLSVEVILRLPEGKRVISF